MKYFDNTIYILAGIIPSCNILQNKARSYLVLLRRADVVAFLHLLMDTLKPLRSLSLALQAQDTNLADVPIKLEACMMVLKTIKDRFVAIFTPKTI